MASFGRLGSLGRDFGNLGGGGGNSDPIIPGTIVARTGTFILTGKDVTFVNLVLTAASGTFTLTGNAATLTNSGGSPSTAGELIFTVPLILKAS